MNSSAPTIAADDFDLDVQILEVGPVVPELMRSTDDNCGSTCASACTTCSKK